MGDLSYDKTCMPVQVTDDEAGAPITSTSENGKRRIDVSIRKANDFINNSLLKNSVVVTASLASNASSTTNIVPGNGKVWDLENTVFSNEKIPTTHNILPRIQIIWDPAGVNVTILDVNFYNTQNIKIPYQIVGNGTKQLRVILTNGAQSAQILKFVLFYQEV